MPYTAKSTDGDVTVSKKVGGHSKVVGHTTPGKKDAYLAALHMHSGDKKTKKENIDGSLGDVYAVQKPYSGCQIGKLIHPFSPINGISIDQMPHDQVHGVFPDKDMAMAVASDLYEAYCKKEEALEEMKAKVTDKLKKTMGMLEKQRSSCMEMIKENPKEARPHKEKVANLTQKI